jgi:regulator of sigma E protease
MKIIMTTNTLMEVLVMVGQLILSLSILIVLHELGHFIPARLFNTRIEKFYLFFDPWFSLFKVKKGDTEYGLGWLPLGGYVKISGMIDESMDREQMKQDPQPWEFRSKPAWQRLIIMIGGVTVNFILGGIIYAGVLWYWGQEFLPADNVSHGIYADSLGRQIGLMDGDKILKVGQEPFKNFSESTVRRAIVIDNVRNLTIDRNGTQVAINIPDDFATDLASHNNKDKVLFGLRVPFVVEKTAPDSPAEKAGVASDDRIIAFNDNPTPFFNDFLALAAQNPNEKVNISLLRGNDTLSLSVTLTNEGKAGIYPKGPANFFQTERLDYSLLAAVPAGFARGWDFLTVQIKAFGQMFKGNIKASDSLGGFASIGQMFGHVWDWERFWSMTAALSLILGFMNLLPIPALDGGHVMFLLYEVVTRKKPSDKVLEWATTAGFFILIALMLFANGLDVLRSCSKM